MKNLLKNKITLLIILTSIWSSSLFAQRVTVHYSSFLAKSIVKKVKNQSEFKKINQHKNLSKQQIDDITSTSAILLTMEPEDAKKFLNQGMKNFLKDKKITKVEFNKYKKLIDGYYNGVNIHQSIENLMSLKAVATSNLMRSITSYVNDYNSSESVTSSLKITKEQARDAAGVIGGVITGAGLVIITGGAILATPSILIDGVRIGIMVGEAIFDFAVKLIKIFKKDGKGGLKKFIEAVSGLANDTIEITDEIIKVIGEATKDTVDSIGKVIKAIGKIFKKKESKSFMLPINRDGGEPDYNPFGPSW